MATANVDKPTSSTSSNYPTAVNVGPLSQRDKRKTHTFTACNPGAGKPRTRSSTKEIPEVPEVSFPNKKNMQRGMWGGVGELQSPFY